MLKYLGHKCLTRFYVNGFFKVLELVLRIFHDHFVWPNARPLYVSIETDERSITTLDIPNGKPIRLYFALLRTITRICYRLPVKVYGYDNRYTKYWPPWNSESLRIRRTNACDVFILYDAPHYIEKITAFRRNVYRHFRVFRSKCFNVRYGFWNVFLVCRKL